MKTRRSKTGTLILICILAILGVCGLCYFIDTVGNGVFAEWFTSRVVYGQRSYYDRKQFNIAQPVWPRFKQFFLVLLVVAVLICILLVFFVATAYARAEVKKTITETSMMLHDFMMGDTKDAEIFPKEYAEISAQMFEIKSTMQRHEQMLKEEASRKNDLIAYLAHDLKTPLTSVIGYLTLLDEARDMPQDQKEQYVNVALNKALRLEQLINEFFDITRYNLQQIDLEKESINLCHMFVQLVDEFYPLLNGHGNIVDVSVDESITIYGDSMKLARVFNNILKNAIYYSYPNSVIKIWAERKENDIFIYFCNKGKTIPAGKLNSIFEKFFRMDEARSTNTGGAGLGLAIAKEIITLHRGTITAKSEDESTTFCISLPIKS